MTRVCRSKKKRFGRILFFSAIVHTNVYGIPSDDGGENCSLGGKPNIVLSARSIRATPRIYHPSGSTRKSLRNAAVARLSRRSKLEKRIFHCFIHKREDFVPFCFWGFHPKIPKIPITLFTLLLLLVFVENKYIVTCRCNACLF